MNVIFKVFITHFLLYIFKTIYNFKLSDHLTSTSVIHVQYWQNSKLTTENTTIADINYKEP
jgi:hypothetical protein